METSKLSSLYNKLNELATTKGWVEHDGSAAHLPFILRGETDIYYIRAYHQKYSEKFHDSSILISNLRQQLDGYILEVIKHEIPELVGEEIFFADNDDSYTHKVKYVI